MKPIFRMASLLMMLMVRPALAVECYETYSPACREKFTADNLPVPHRPDPLIRRDMILLGEVRNHILDAQALDRRAEALRQAIQVDEAPRLGPESEDDKTLRLDKILAQRKRLREIETNKYAAYNAAIEKTIDLYQLSPKVTDPINHMQFSAEGMRPWAPRYSENETYERDQATGILMGRRLGDEEKREIWKRRGVTFSANTPVPPANGAGTSKNGARIALFPGAFSSPDHLASLIFHETTHWLDRNARGRAANPSEHFESEIRAYQKQIEVQKTFNLRPTDVKLLEKIKGIYVAQLRDNDTISWKEMERKHPEWLRGSNLLNPPAAPSAQTRAAEGGGRARISGRVGNGGNSGGGRGVETKAG